MSLYVDVVLGLGWLLSLFWLARLVWTPRTRRHVWGELGSSDVAASLRVEKRPR